MAQQSKNSTPPEKLPSESEAPISVFVVSPIGAADTETYRKARYALEYLIRVALPEPRWAVHRADEGTSPGSISHHVIDNIHKSDLIVVDLTDHNPNVFYELAIAHAWKKPVVHIIEKGQKIPFDIIDQRTISYDLQDLASVHSAVGAIRESALWALDHNDELMTPMRQYERVSAASADPEGSASLLSLQFDELTRRLSNIERSLVNDRNITTNSARHSESRISTARLRKWVQICDAYNLMDGAENIGPEQAEEYDVTMSRMNSLAKALGIYERLMLVDYLKAHDIPVPRPLEISYRNSSLFDG